MSDPVTFEAFCHQRGLAKALGAEVDGHIHAALRSKPTTKTFARFYERELRRLQGERDQALEKARREYGQAIESGEIRQLTPTESLQIRANGHPDLEATRAARRLLDKRDATNETQEATICER